jgi:hypothetical protein
MRKLRTHYENNNKKEEWTSLPIEEKHRRAAADKELGLGRGKTRVVTAVEEATVGDYLGFHRSKPFLTKKQLQA